ncbi:SPOR domain-containing protein [Pontibacter diazotrophicus]|uniref:SPOR domain-containing protein n=1 Tax=Pontibacter diazotrophicus TaxID=1400979 RepID=A0A3D8LC04_9BACT|nr:HU family DNA-binding protein [Pontibacter diazotrophicus]RDV14824.1 SPOR domain-containing protein [Pontibacter diazotrophicus]
MVAKHIKSLLYDHDCVIIPEFGGLITRYVSAKINPVKHSFAPPSKKIAFNEKLVLNDGLLISTIAYQNNISKEEAQQLVTSFVQQAKTTLHAENRFELQEIGVFRYNPEHKLEFEYVEGENLLDASFGLPELVARPVRVEEPAVLRTLIKERQQEHAKEKQPLRKRLKRAYNVAAGLALAGLTGSALYFLSLQADYNLSSLNPIMLVNASYTSSNTGDITRYASGYVPVTGEERVATYAAILPQEATAVVLEQQQPALEEQTFLTADSASASLVFMPEEQQNEEVKEEVVVPVKEVKPAEPVLTINEKSGRSYIIIGGYSTTENAAVRRDAARTAGHDSKMLTPGPNSKLYRVSVADFATADEAKAVLNNYKKSFGETIWVLNY